MGLRLDAAGHQRGLEADVPRQVVAEAHADVARRALGDVPDERLEIIRVAELTRRIGARDKLLRGRPGGIVAARNGGVVARAPEVARRHTARARKKRRGGAGERVADGGGGKPVVGQLGGGGDADGRVGAGAGTAVEGAGRGGGRTQGGSVLHRVVGAPALGLVGVGGERLVDRGIGVARGVGGVDVDAEALGARAGEEGVGLLAAVGVEVIAVARGDLEADVVLAGDDVDHARGGVGSVNRRSAVLQHLDALDHRDGDAVEVDEDGAAAADAVGRDAAPVDEHERVVGPEETQIDRRGAAHGSRGAALIDAEVGSLGHVAHDVGEVVHPRERDLLAGDETERRGTLHLGLLDKGTGDLELLELGRTGGGSRLRGGGDSREQREKNQTRDEAQRHGAGIHGKGSRDPGV